MIPDPTPQLSADPLWDALFGCATRLQQWPLRILYERKSDCDEGLDLTRINSLASDARIGRVFRLREENAGSEQWLDIFHPISGQVVSWRLKPREYGGFFWPLPEDKTRRSVAFLVAWLDLRKGQLEAKPAAGRAVAGLDEKAASDGKNDSDLDRKFMEKAVEEARKSRTEDGRVHPKVGVVIVKDGKQLAVAYRGELDKGEHAEFTALERKLADVGIAGATVYTTLEPCTTRNHPKLPCADRLIERKVRRVVVGMHDPNPKISGKGFLKLREANIAVDLFHPDLMSKIEEMNREFIRHHKNAAEPATSPPATVPDSMRSRPDHPTSR